MIQADLLVVGGGAAGYFAALRAKELHPSLQVVIAEADRQTLRKVRISGGGRCNVTQSCFDPASLVRAYPRGEKELRGPFSRFQPEDTIKWFTSRGVELKTEKDGRVFPTTDSSETIIDCLERTRRDLGVELWKQTKLRALRKEGAEFVAEFETSTSKRLERFASVILATGGARSGYDISAALGHTIEPCVPSLFTFKVEDPRIAHLSGVATADVAMILQVGGNQEFVERGPILTTHWGFSGPAVIRLSAWAARPLADSSYRALLQLNWLPSFSNEEIRTTLERCRERSAKKSVRSEPVFSIAKRLWESLVDASGITPDTKWAGTSKKQLQSLISQLTEAEFSISGKGVFKEEFVTCGGVSLREVNFKTMESRIVPRLYFAGELLDIDGITGGYNFQCAWTTGWIAGSAIQSE